jgi:hypothetical protein
MQQVGVVDDGAEELDTEALGGGDPLADGEVGVPEVRDSGVVEEACVPGGAFVGGQDGCPDGVDAELRGGVLLEELLADPTGSGEAGASGGREEEQQTGVAGVRVEALAKLAQAGDVDKRRLRARLCRCTGRRPFGGGCGSVGAGAAGQREGARGDQGEEGEAAARILRERAHLSPTRLPG